ncbi:ABC transporter permease [Variovorax terrae]|uniref:ABC transporter permease n=1 Tax=Variovorax terrae TaxID=2923278 RepID=A0A9X1VYC3_9BURK|nr:ABC transporter permease [Variovorax terrae]MCJ0765901.1 ABC transporter permease [Variovorax terrae]
MLAFVIRRILQSFAVVLAMSAIVFGGIYAVGNPVEILVSPTASEAEKLETTQRLGLDKPLYVQYARFVRNALHGDLGQSFAFGAPAADLIFQRLPATLELALSAMLIAIALGIPLGLWAGLHPQARSGRFIMGTSIVGFSLPTFWVGIVLIMVFSVLAGVMPSGGRGATTPLFGVPVSFLNWDGLKHLVLPALNLALFNISMIIRLTKAGAQEAMLSDYVKFARAKGLGYGRIIGVHVLKNILIPIITVIALQFGAVVAFAIVTESIFSWPGMGKLLIDSIGVLDRPVVVAYLMMTVLMFIVVNLAVDIAYSALDPRVRLH